MFSCPHLRQNPSDFLYQIDMNTSLSSILKDVNISEAGLHFLTMASDPFHDNAQHLVGLPDGNPGDSVVLECKRSFILRNAARSDWDAVITTMPCITSVGKIDLISSGERNTTPGVNDHHSISYDSDPFVPRSTVVAIYGDGGTPLFPDDLTWTIANPGADYIVPFVSGFDDTHCRIIAAGIEVVNTSPKINQRGSITVSRNARVPYTKEQFLQVHGGTGLFDLDSVTQGGVTSLSLAKYSALVAPRWSATVDEATAVPNSQTWDASKGAYCVVTFDPFNNPPRPETSEKLIFNESSDTHDVRHAVALTAGNLETTVLSSDPVIEATSRVPLPFTFSPIDQTEIFITGQDENCSFRVTGRIFIEIFPSRSDSRVSEATPTALYDPVALQLYNEIVRAMPPGVPVGQNASGDWWRKVVSVVKDAIPFVVPLLASTQPELSAALSALSLGSRVLSDKKRPQARRRRIESRRAPSDARKMR